MYNHNELSVVNGIDSRESPCDDVSVHVGSTYDGMIMGSRTVRMQFGWVRVR